MTTFAGTLHARDTATGAPRDVWQVVPRRDADAALCRRLGGAPELRVILDGAGAVYREVRSYRPDGTLLRGEGGKPLNVGVAGVGWQTVPLTAFAFRIAERPKLGVFVHTSTAWATADSLARSGLLDRLKEGEPVAARLSVQRHRFTARNGPTAGRLVDYSCAGVAIE